MRIYFFGASFFALLSVSAQLNQGMMHEVLSLDSSISNRGENTFILIQLQDKKDKPKYTMVEVGFLQEALRMENRRDYSPYPSMHEEILSNYENGYLFNRSKAYKNIPIHFSSKEQLDSLESSGVFKKCTKQYLKDFDFAKRVSEYEHIPDSLNYFLDNYEEVYIIPTVEIPFKYHFEFIQLMWSKGILVLERHNRRLSIYSIDRFRDVYGN